MRIDQPPNREMNAEKAEIITAFLTGRDLGCHRIVSVQGLLLCDGQVIAARHPGRLIINTRALTGERRRVDLVEAVEALARLCGKAVLHAPVRVCAPDVTLAGRAYQFAA